MAVMILMKILMMITTVCLMSMMHLPLDATESVDTDNDGTGR